MTDWHNHALDACGKGTAMTGNEAQPDGNLRSPNYNRSNFNKMYFK